MAIAIRYATTQNRANGNTAIERSEHELYYWKRI
jgi:hypothetical protein